MASGGRRTRSGALATLLLRLRASRLLTLAAIALLSAFGVAHAQTQPGQVIANTVGVTYDYQGAPGTAIASDQFAVEAASASPEMRGRVFDSATGAPIDGATVTIVDAASGAPALVFGSDGVSAYPASVTSGATTTDAGGATYAASPGAYRFPQLAPGQYRIVITPPLGYSAPSSSIAAALQMLPGAPLAIDPTASFGGAFPLANGAVALDLPIDPQFGGELRVAKGASVSVASVGDVVLYSVRVESLGAGAPGAVLEDRPPAGFALIRDSVRLNGARVSFLLGADGRSFALGLGDLTAGQSVEVTYALQVGPRAQRGYAANRAEAASGGARSNVATAAVLVRDDMLRDVSFIAGEVTMETCPARGAPRPPAARGAAGVRLYIEDGASAVTDNEGRFHFENVSPGLHVVQIDPATVPDGFEVSRTSLTTRNAGRASSVFVEVRPGALGRADFCLSRTPTTAFAALAADAATAEEDAEPAREDATAPGFVLPNEGARLRLPLVSVSVAHILGQRVELSLDGQPVDPLAYEGVTDSQGQILAISAWRGIHLSEGEHTLEAVAYDAAGLRVARYARRIVLPGAATAVEVDTPRSTLAADGRTEPTVALLFRDAAGRPAREGERLEISIDAPYMSAASAEAVNAAPLTAAGPGLAPIAVTVGLDGVAILPLAPTLKSGQVRMRVRVAGREIPLTAWLRAARHDWLIVGLGEAGATSNPGADGAALESHAFARGALDGGRVAVFGRGSIGDDWLLRFAYDSSRERAANDERLFGERPPDRHFPLYGDASRTDREAETSGPLFLRVERPRFHAQFGDFDTGLDDVELSRYARRLHGFQSAYDGGGFTANVFASEATGGFQRDEMQGDGVSGPYPLSSAPIIINSERISVETRDRLEPNTILSTRVLTRHLDYEIDYDRGVLQLRDVFSRTDAEFNPQIIVAEYESVSTDERQLHYGGRLAARLLADRVELGATYIRQDDDVRGGDLLGLDATLQLTASTRIVAEVAGAGDGVGTDGGQADLIRLEHAGERFTAQVTARRQEDGFGLGHEMASASGLETLSGEAVLRINRTDAFDLRVAQNEMGGLGRDFGEVALRRRVGAQNYRLGFLSASDDGAEIGGLRSDLVFAEVSYGLLDERLILGALHAQPLAGRVANPDFPGRTALRADWAVIDGLSLSAVHEWQEGDAFDGVLTRAGLTGSPWRGAQVTSGAGVQSSESGERLMSNLGLSQAWSLDEGWSVSAALDARQTLRGGAQSPLPSSLRSADWIGEDYSAASLGLARAGATSGFSARLEGRVSQADDRLLLQVGGYDESDSPLSLATDFTLQASRSALGDSLPLIRLRQGAAVRDGLRGRTVFYRLDLFYREVPAEQQIVQSARRLRQWRAVGNALLGLDTAPDTELNLQFGLKLSNDEILGGDYTTIAGLLGADWRYDLSAVVDIGVSGSVITVWPSDETSGHLGVSLGINPADNLWLSTGFNLVGYQEGDFVGGAYRSEGLFARLRLKFDQETARSVLAE